MQGKHQELVKAYPGKLLGNLADYTAGSGTYAYLNQIYASKKGTVKVS